MMQQRPQQQVIAMPNLALLAVAVAIINAIQLNIAPAAVEAAGTRVAATPAPAPAPAPAPSFENVTQSLVFGGEYSSFIELLEESKVDVMFQSLANDTAQGSPGITIFAPTDDAFKTKLVSSRLPNLTALQKVRLAEYHALNVYQAFANLQNSNNNVTSTFATFNGGGGGRYQVNLTFTGGGRLEIASGWTTARISTTIYSKHPVSIFAIDQVLLPDEIFGLPPPPPPPAPPAPLPPAPSPSTPLRAPPASPSHSSASTSSLRFFNYVLPCSSASLLFSVLFFHLLHD